MTHSGSTLSSESQSMNELPKEGVVFVEGIIMLMKDMKPISRVQYIDSPMELTNLNIVDIKVSAKYNLCGLPCFLLRPAFNNRHHGREWKLFTDHLMEHDRVARAVGETYEFYILPPDQGTNFNDAIVFYRLRKEDSRSKSDEAVMKTSITRMSSETWAPLEVVSAPSTTTSAITEAASCKPHDLLEKNYVRTDPSYLRTLGQTHSGWVFGAVAELVDNSRDAKATKLDISIKSLVKDGKEIPYFSVIDDGHGMSHEEMLKMLSFGRKAPDVDDPSSIGRFGIGFKTGSMRIGRDAIVLTQTATSRSIGFLSQSLNEGKDMLEVPIVSYRWEGLMMDIDTSVQTRSTAEYNLEVIKKFSHFNEYSFGALFSDKGVGTQIYIWNLDEWGSNYCLDWVDGNATSPEGDILIRSRRIRGRPGQISCKVPLDYSLRSYLEVIFLDPRMKIYVQGSLVRSHPLAKSLNKTDIVKGHILGKHIQLTLGRSQLEWKQMNCGIFLYWHGRLIEAYKRVGGMIHNGDVGRGVIGVMDVTELMDDGKDVWVHNHKQGFQDCEVYAKLEEWLGQRADEYWDKNFDFLEVKKCNAADYKPDHDWVQCYKCRKWRKLSHGFDTKSLPPEWFCYMPPFTGRCGDPEEEEDKDVVIVASKQTACEEEDGTTAKEKQILNGKKRKMVVKTDKRGPGRRRVMEKKALGSAKNTELKKVGSCFFCGKPGHLKSNCRDYLASLGNKEEMGLRVRK